MNTHRNRPKAVITSAERHNSKSVDNQNIRLQQYLDKCVEQISVISSQLKKRRIMTAYCYGLLSIDQTERLIRKFKLWEV